MKRGQLLGQPFVYIFIAVVAVLVLIFGIRILVNYQDLGESTLPKLFIIDIEKKFNTVSTDSTGSVVSLMDIKVPSNLYEICFVDYIETFSLNNTQDAKLKVYIEQNRMIQENNLFIVGDGILEAKRIDDLNLNEFAVCDSLKDGKINIKLTNEGQEIKAEVI